MTDVQRTGEYVAVFCPNCGVHLNEHELSNDHGYTPKQVRWRRMIAWLDSLIQPVRPWVVNCEQCLWVLEVDGREEAIAEGMHHSFTEHPGNYSFRFRQFRKP